MGTPRWAFRGLILAVLVEMGGRGRVRKILDRIYRMVGTMLTPYDLDLVSSGGERRWKNETRWARDGMVREGLLKDDSPHGIWELTPAAAWAVARRESAT